MRTFLVRIILHSTTDLANIRYDKLHSAMETAGFSRKIQDANGNWFHLPPAEYIIDTTATANSVQNLAQNVATSVDTNNGVLTVEIFLRNIEFSGLQKVI